jgi:hypothetical protein
LQKIRRPEKFESAVPGGRRGPYSPIVFPEIAIIFPKITIVFLEIHIVTFKSRFWINFSIGIKSMNPVEVICGIIGSRIS